MTAELAKELRAELREFAQQEIAYLTDALDVAPCARWRRALPEDRTRFLERAMLHGGGDAARAGASLHHPVLGKLVCVCSASPARLLPRPPPSIR